MQVNCLYFFTARNVSNFDCCLELHVLKSSKSDQSIYLDQFLLKTVEFLAQILVQRPKMNILINLFLFF